MPTKKRRLNIVLPPELDEALKEFSEVSGQSQASFVTACLLESLDSLKLLTEAIREAKAGNLSASEQLIAQSLGTNLLKLGKGSED